MIIIELNEFNPDLLASYASKLNLSSIHKVLNFKHCVVTTEDTEERFGLDPWVQWVNIHTGKTREEHKIEHLGDIYKLSKDIPQIWEDLLENQDIKYNVWGAMNASSRYRGDASCSFFPDPWTFGVSAHPEEINKLLALPRFYAKNYLNLKQYEGLKAAISTASYLLSPSNIVSTAKLIPSTAKAITSIGINSNVLFTLFDRLTSSMFLKHVQPSQLNIIFLNSVAHLQHNYWSNVSKNQDIEYCLKSFDLLLGRILEKHPHEPLMLMNAFRQVQSYDKNEFLYRQKDTEDFLNKANITFESVNQLMTNDAHIVFRTAETLEFAAQALEKCTVDGKRAFHIETDGDNLSLFYQFIIWDDLGTESRLSINGKSLLFYDIYRRVVRRTGSHISLGDVFYRGLTLPKTLQNSDIYNHITAHFSEYYGHSNHTHI